MKSLKKFVCTLLAAAMMTTALAGCSGNGSGTGGKTESSVSGEASASDTKSPSGSITVSGWNDAADALTATAKAFMKQYPDTKVTIQKVDNQYTKLYSELAANSGVPDVVSLQNRDLQSFKNKYPDAWLDLTDFLTPEKENYSSALLALVTVDGKYWAVPWDQGPCAMYYRKDIFENAGVDISTIKTYDDYIEAGKKIVKATNGKTKMLGFDYSGSSSGDIEMLMINQIGGQYYDENGKVKLDSDKMIQVMNLLKKMIKAGITVNLPNEWNDRITATENDQIASIPYGAWYSGTLQNSNSDQAGKWAIAELPAFTSGGNTQANSGGSVLAISSATKNENLAKAFVKYALMTSEGNKESFNIGKLFAAYQPAYKDDEYTATDDYFGFSLGKTFSNLSNTIPDINFGPYFTDISNAYRTAIGEVFIKGKDTKQALSEATATAQKAIDNE